MRTTILTVLTTVALVLVTVGPTAALQEASRLSTGYLAIGRVTSTADIGPRRQQDRGSGIGVLAFNISKRKQKRVDECKGLVDQTLFPICQQRVACYTHADFRFMRVNKSIECGEPCKGVDGLVQLPFPGFDVSDAEAELDAAQVLCDKTYPHPSD